MSFDEILDLTADVFSFHQVYYTTAYTSMPRITSCPPKVKLIYVLNWYDLIQYCVPFSRNLSIHTKTQYNY